MEVSFCSGRYSTWWLGIPNESKLRITYSWICNDAGRLHLDDLLHELDAADLDP